MDQQQLYHSVCQRTSTMTTKAYSTSFSLGISILDKDIQDPIYAIYGFVRFADEIVDTFHDYPKGDLLDEFKRDTFLAIERGISVNPILHSFQKTVNDFKIDHELIETFLYSMEMDLTEKEYDRKEYETYILGSAEVVGLMCLKVFLRGDEHEYQRLKPSAMKLGAAFQKINFLRDMHADYEGMGRTYFPGIDLRNFSEQDKYKIESEIEQDFQDGLEGIRQLPNSAKFGVYLAFIYYYALFQKIQRLNSSVIMEQRVRISDRRKYWILLKSYAKFRLNMI